MSAVHTFSDIPTILVVYCCSFGGRRSYELKMLRLGGWQHFAAKCKLESAPPVNVLFSNLSQRSRLHIVDHILLQPLIILLSCPLIAVCRVIYSVQVNQHLRRAPRRDIHTRYQGNLLSIQYITCRYDGHKYAGPTGHNYATASPCNLLTPRQK